MSAHAVDAQVERQLTVNELARALNVSRSQVYALVRAGALRPSRVGARMRFSPEEVRRYLSAGQQE